MRMLFLSIACLLAAGSVLGDVTDEICPCVSKKKCERAEAYGALSPDDVSVLSALAPCEVSDQVRCCSVEWAQKIDLRGEEVDRVVVKSPRRVVEVAARRVVEDDDPVLVDENDLNVAEDKLHPAVLRFADQINLDGVLELPAPSRKEAQGLDINALQNRFDVQQFKAAQDKLKEDIANGISNPNPPCGCYTENTCPIRYAKDSFERDIGCHDGWETCCFFDDPWPNYVVTNLTINIPCSTIDTCVRRYGQSVYDVRTFGALEPCYLGQERCLDLITEGTEPEPEIIKPPTTPRPRPTTPRYTRPPTTRPTRPPTRPTYRPTTRPTYRPTTRPTYRPTTRPTYRPTTRPTYRPTTRPTYRPTTRPTYRPTTRRPRPTYRPRTTTYRPRTTTYRTRYTPPTTSPTTRRTTGYVYTPPTTTERVPILPGYLPPSNDFGSAGDRADGYAQSLPF